MLPIDTNKLYPDAKYQWELVDDCVAGSQAIKKKGELYLPVPNPTDDSDENRIRFQQYLQRAMFYNATGRTKTGMVGAVFRRHSALELAPQIKYIEDNVDGANTSLMQQARATISGILMHGRSGLLVDMPAVDIGSVTMRDVATGIRPGIYRYGAHSILDWHEIDGRLVYVKLDESMESFDSETLEREDVERYRVLVINDQGVYVQRTYANGDLAGEYMPIASGDPLDFIPFVIAGAVNNCADIDKAPLFDLATVNVGHYRNSADYEEACFISGQVTLGVTSSYDLADFKEANPNGVMVGSRAGHFLGESGALTMVQAAPNIMPAEAMKEKEKLMISLGADVIAGDGVQRTATEIISGGDAKTSSLSLVAGNASAAYTSALGWCEMFMGVEGGGSAIAINKEFFPVPMTADDLRAWSELVQMGIVPDSAFFEKMRKSGNFDEDTTDEEIRAQISETAPAIIDDGMGGD